MKICKLIFIIGVGNNGKYLIREAIDDFLTYSFFINRNCSNEPCLGHNLLNDIQQKIDQEEDKNAKVKIFIERCKKISLSFLI